MENVELVDDNAKWPTQLVDILKQNGAIVSPEIESTFLKVPRHMLIENIYQFDNEWHKETFDPYNPTPAHLEYIYSNKAIVIGINGDAPSSSASQPGLVANMLELLELRPGMKVLEIGAGTGYNAALMSNLVGGQSLIVSVDIQKDLIARTQRLLSSAGYPNIKLVARDGFEGVIEEAPYDRIVATVGCPDLSPHWAKQLSPLGEMLIPLSHGGWHPLIKVWKDNDDMVAQVVSQSGFMPIIGTMATTELWQYDHNAIFPFESAQEMPPIDSSYSREDLFHFYYFMSFRDLRSFWNIAPLAYGLHDATKGYIAISPQTGNVLLRGDNELLTILRHLYIEWREAGKPKRTDFRITFLLHGQPKTLKSRWSWKLKRKFYTQWFELT